MAAPRDTIFGMYAHMNARNYIRYIHLLSVFIRGHQISIEVTLGHQRSHVNNSTQKHPLAPNGQSAPDVL